MKKGATRVGRAFFVEALLCVFDRRCYFSPRFL